MPLIGTAVPFNVITQDQLPHFISNGFLSQVGDVNGDIKAHIVIQQQQPNDTVNGGGQANISGTQDSGHINMTGDNLHQSNQNVTMNHQQQQQQHTTTTNWNDTCNAEVLQVRCKQITAELYKARLGSGSRGKCIKYKDEWMTPSEFENMCGRGSSKDWKRSIHSGGRGLHLLITEGILTPHATSCTCSVCCEDDASKFDMEYGIWPSCQSLLIFRNVCFAL